VCTVGQLSVWPGAGNVIAGAVNLTVDIRSRHDGVRSAVVADVAEAVRSIAERRGVGHSIALKHEADALECSRDLRSRLEEAVGAVNTRLAPSSARAPLLVSGAGHDGMALAQLCEVGMVFVRCRGGVSHSPLEHTDPAGACL